MAEDDDKPRKKPVHELGQDLARLSIAELEERIVLLRAEIARLEQSMEDKRASQSVAASFFKK